MDTSFEKPWSKFTVGEDGKLPLHIDPMADRRDVANQVIEGYADEVRVKAGNAGNPIVVQQVMGAIADALDEVSQKRE